MGINYTTATHIVKVYKETGSNKPLPKIKKNMLQDQFHTKDSKLPHLKNHQELQKLKQRIQYENFIDQLSTQAQHQVNQDKQTQQPLPPP